DTESGEGDAEETKSDRESEEEEIREEEEESFDPIPRTPEDSKDDGNGEEDQGLRQESSSVSSFVTSMLNPISDACVESIFTTASSPIAPLQTPTPIMTPSTIVTITTSSDAPIPPTTIPSETNQFAEAVSNIPGIVDQYMNHQMTEAVKSQVKEQVSRILPRIEESVNAQLEAEVLTRSSHSSRTSYEVAADLTEMELKKSSLKRWKEINTTILKRRRGDDDDQEGPSAGSDRGSKRRREGREPESASTPSEPATRSASRSTTGTQSRQMSASESAFAEEPVQTTCQIDEPPHPVFETSHRVIPFAHFINNDLEYLRGGASSRKYTTSVTKTKAADYGHIKWIEDLVPRTMWIQKFYGFAVNRESVLDVYSKRRIIAVTDLKIVEWKNYKHLDWISPLPLIPDNRGRRVIPFAHFINNDLEYLRGEVSLAGKTVQDAEKFKQSVDLLHLFQTTDVGVHPSDRTSQKFRGQFINAEPIHNEVGEVYWSVKKFIE
nr:hypothetical protein [Tanacetum cinerariifolium]